jgi:predicted MFS family arabinose efflux permease
MLNSTPANTEAISSPRGTRMRFQLIVFGVTRTIINTAFRLVYPFMPFIAAGLSVEENAIRQIIFIRSLLGIAAPLLGAWADKLGRKTAMMMGMAMFVGGMALIAIWPTHFALAAMIMLVAAGKILFEPAMYAYIADNVDYQQRGMAIAVTELGWSGAFVLGMPLAGRLIEIGGWAAPFPWIALTAIIVAVLLWRILPSGQGSASNGISLLGNLTTVVRHPTALAGLGVGLSMSAANEVIAITFAEWLQDDFVLTATALGLATVVIGIAELGGEGVVAGLVDRIGKRRAVLLGMALNVVANFALPSMGQTLAGALFGLFLVYLTFEFALVSMIPLMTEFLPEARATLMAANVSAFAMGRALGAAIGLFGLTLTASTFAAVGLDAAAILLLILVVRQD